jgi:hypothetical protein
MVHFPHLLYDESMFVGRSRLPADVQEMQHTMGALRCANQRGPPTMCIRRGLNL